MRQRGIVRIFREIKNMQIEANGLTSSFLENEILLWPGTAPGSEQVRINQQIIERSTDPNIADRAIMGISAPSIIPFFPEEGNGNGSAVVIAPGGAYERLVFDKEGYDIAKWFNSLGVAAFVLKYRLPGEGHQNGHAVPLQDAQRAIRFIKYHAPAWKLDPGKIGFTGFSAGGHLAATVSTHYAESVYSPVDKVDESDSRPNFAILGYPVIHSAGRESKLNFAPLGLYEITQHVDFHTPPAFIMHAHDDTGVSSENSIEYYLALKKAGVEAELHIFRTGNHGFGIRLTRGPISFWTELCKQWLASIGII